MTGPVHDVLVIGAGIGGLTAAALAADAGLDVFVAEGHTRAGGCAGDFQRRGVLFPAGATVVMGFEEGGLHRTVYDRLGIPIRARRLDRAMTVHLPDRDVGVLTDASAWDDERRRAFPELGRRGEHFWAEIRSLAGIAHDLAGAQPALPISTVGDVLGVVKLARPALVRTMPALWRTVGDLLAAHDLADQTAHRRFVDLQLLISMQCLADECVALNGALALDVYRFGTFALPGGTATIAEDLIDALRARGGTLEYRAWVRQIGRSGSDWVATLASGAQVRARAVIANIPPPDLLPLLDVPRPPTIERAATRMQPWGAVVLHAALDARGIEGPLPRYHQTLDAFDGSLEDGGSCFVSLLGPHPTRHPELARLTVSTHTRVEPWWRLRDRDDYQARKQVAAERLLAAAERAVPDLRRRLRFSEVATPRTFRQWTGRHEGRVGGLPQTRANAGPRAVSRRSGIPGLYLCGDSVFPGQGTIGVTLSGILAAREATSHVGRQARRRLGTRPVPPPLTAGAPLKAGQP